MSYRTPPHRAAAVNETKNALLASRRAVLTTHLNADGDGGITSAGRSEIDGHEQRPGQDWRLAIGQAAKECSQQVRSMLG